MNVFSKLFSGKCTRFLFLLTALFLLIAFWLFNNGYKEKVSSENNKSEIESVIPESNKAEIKQNNYEKITTTPLSEEIKPESGDSVQGQSNEKSSEDAIAEFMKSLSAVQKPFNDQPGYREQLIDFDIEITNAETNDEFPSESFRLKDLKGNVVILFFTTTWCPNCVKVFQDLDKLVSELSGKNISNVKIVTLILGTENDDAVKSYYETNKIKSLRRFKSVSPLFFKAVRVVPTCFVFDKKSVPVWGFSGAANYGDPNFLNFIEDLSKEDAK